MDATMMDSLPGKMKKSKFVALNKKIEEGMTDDQKKEEADFYYALSNGNFEYLDLSINLDDKNLIDQN
uniref:Uncharacterized protein n=1 Tax=Romanomermis culicivorax TaxID=13658 RepID=A0A915K519_ROMCU